MVAMMSRAVINLRYGPPAFWRIVEGWAEYGATGRRPRRTWAEDSAISHRYVQTEGPFCAGAAEYADFDCVLDGLAPFQRRAAGLYWRDGLRSVRRVALAMGIHMDTARQLVWAGTEAMIVRLCGLTPADAHAEARLYREKFHNYRT